MNPSSASLNCNPVKRNIYHMNIPLFVLDVVRMFQDHPKYKNKLGHRDLVELLRQENFANGDLDSQIGSAVMTLEYLGYIRYINNGYRTLGPYARLTKAKNIKQKIKAWDEIQKKFCIGTI
ncbi:uncharacterized protein LOC129919926 [Episyrphus balteatus]|uniref:uncharacterized protein LOC129919926 n=1 Tax=Episyrphus balteatus TaxID=286459 RepID=UPI00248662D8|nr:uncharacterized protein LOC129919926 [Episyrphus balteatus]